MSKIRTAEIRTFLSSEFKHPYVSENQTLGFGFQTFAPENLYFRHILKGNCLKTKFELWFQTVLGYRSLSLRVFFCTTAFAQSSDSRLRDRLLVSKNWGLAFLPLMKNSWHKADSNDGPLKAKILQSECSPSKLAGPGLLLVIAGSFIELIWQLNPKCQQCGLGPVQSKSADGEL